MTNNSRNLAVLAAIAAGLLPATAARAQWYSSSYAQPAPLYPYAVQPQQPYAVEVAPNTYVIQRPANTRAYPYVDCRNGCGRRTRNPNVAPPGPASDRPHKPADHALIEELRNRGQVKRTVINTTKIVHDPPVVVETKRYVDDPPRVIERRHVVEDEPPPPQRRKYAAPEERDTANYPKRDDSKKRVIQADAEITILGPDRMSIRLFRKEHRSNAKARED